MAGLQSIVFCAYIIISSSEARSITDTYDEERNTLLNKELDNSLGGNLQLTDDELVANEILMQLKINELQQIIENPRLFNYTDSFLKFRKNIERSRVYHIIKKMPKGAALHIHTSMMLDADSLIELTYEENLFACFTEDDLKIVFSNGKPEQHCVTQWNLLSDLRQTAEKKAFDDKLKKYMTIDERYVNVDEQKIWDYFEKKFAIVNALTKYEPVREKFFYKALQHFYDDNIRYIELRGGLSSLYALNGTVYDYSYTARLHERIVKQFVQDHPDFIGAKWIVTIQRKTLKKDMKKAIEQALELQAQLPDFIIGFDLVGREDLGQPLNHYLPILKENRDLIRYYFHSGETNWNGMDVDENLIDAILLGTRRIAHGNALIKHPSLINLVKQKGIAIEVNPISNCVLGLAKDLRTHPLAAYLALNLPVVISSDDPGSWNSDPLSHDFFVTFMLIASKRADLRLLKQLVFNSIKYSELDNEGKTKMRNLFHESWAEFIQYISKIDPEGEFDSDGIEDHRNEKSEKCIFGKKHKLT